METVYNINLKFVESSYAEAMAFQRLSLVIKPVCFVLRRGGGYEDESQYWAVIYKTKFLAALENGNSL